ncbi:YY1-associated factor 2-like isoform X1 [Cyprinodon tularosa]|uniref:YY1-associated factor 2-like isoform X1 n=1 Tax=Cyprinodon tularosa TaxID=77115 RepID=UPI0018E1DC57|nr:YY1-associated factor 2-like isoform X1 [Cyprinodon tularosa]
MGDKKSPTRPKRQSKPSDDGFWDCSVCTFKNSAEAFKCSMCDVRKGTSTRKPRPVSQLVAKVNQQFASPTHPKKEKKEKSEKDKSEKDTTLKKKNQKRMSRPRLKNIDRSSAQHLEVTVGDLTVIITDFKEKVKPTSSSASAASADQHSQSGSSSDNTERGVSRSSSPRAETSSINGEIH